MRHLKYVALFGVLLFAAGHAQAQDSFDVGEEPFSADVGPAPVCPYGYYGYYPYYCAPYGYYGPDYFVDGIFIGAGPWFHGGYRGYYGRSGHGYYRPGYGASPAMVTDRGMATGPDMLIDQGMAIGQDTATGALLPAALSEAATVVAMHAAASAGIVVVDFTAAAPTVVAGTAAEAPTVVAAFMAVAGTASSERFNSRMDFHRMENCRSPSLPSPPPSRSIASTGDSATFFT